MLSVIKRGFKNTDWDVVSGISPNETSYKLSGLSGGDKYVYKVGLEKGDEQIISEKKKFKTKREWGLFKTTCF